MILIPYLFQDMYDDDDMTMLSILAMMTELAQMLMMITEIDAF